MKRKQVLEIILDSHDCHLGPESSCDCLDIRRELAVINYKNRFVPYKYHSKLSRGFTYPTEKELYDEVRELRD